MPCEDDDERVTKVPVEEYRPQPQITQSIGHSLAAILTPPPLALPPLVVLRKTSHPSPATTVPTGNTAAARCKYKTKRCPNPRTFKVDGTWHSLCAYHRLKQNQAQARSDARRRPLITKRRRERRLRLQQQQQQETLDEQEVDQHRPYG